MGWQREGDGGQRLLEDQAAGGQGVEVRGARALPSVRPEPVRAQGVDGEQQDVRGTRGGAPPPPAGRERSQGHGRGQRQAEAEAALVQPCAPAI